MGRPGHQPRGRPEDEPWSKLTLGKLWYYREGGSEKHLRDIAGIMQVSGDEIDTRYIDHWAHELGLAQEWQAILDRLRGPK